MAERLWAPWRMEYVSQDEKSGGCLFCRVRDESDDAANLVLVRHRRAFLMMNAFPYTNGHLMAVPERHTPELTSLSPEEIADVMGLVQRGMDALKAVYGPHGFNVGINLGSAAGAGIADHLHVHIVPRWVGDTNFMAAVGDVRVLPDSLEGSYEKIREQLAVQPPTETPCRSGLDADRGVSEKP